MQPDKPWVKEWRRFVAEQVELRAQGMFESEWDSNSERLSSGDVGPSDGHRLASPPFKIAIRDEGLTGKYPKYLRMQLDEYIENHPTRAQHLSGCHVGDGSSNSTYRALSKNEIRVLECSPGHFANVLRGRLHVVDIQFEFELPIWNFKPRTAHVTSVLDGHPVFYTALSYVWGETMFEGGIWIDNQILKVTKSLETCIRHLRREDQPVMLWIDQICIDQNNLREKEQQILLMRTIYTRAWNTVIWLGPEPAAVAFEAIHLLDGGTGLLGDSLSEAQMDHICSKFRQEPELLSALTSLFCRPWFTRTWTIQEVVLSQEPYLMSGTSVVHLDDFANCMNLRDLGVMDLLTRGQNCHDMVVLGIDAVSELYLLKSFYQTHEGKAPIDEMLVKTRYAAVTKPVDKIYGILGLCKHAVVPDYSKTTLQVVFETTADAIRQELIELETAFIAGRDMIHGCHGVSRILCCVDHDPKDLKSQPSWVPDWTRPRLTASFGYSTYTQKFYKAGGPMIKHDVIQMADGDKTLIVQARRVDVIHSLSEVVREAELSATRTEHTNGSLRMCIAFTKSHLHPNHPQPTFLPFCETIVAGKNGEGIDTCGGDYIEVLSLLCDEVSGRSPSFEDQTYSVRQQKGHLTLEHLGKRKPGRVFRDLKKAYKLATLWRRLCWTSAGRLGLVPRFSQEGDEIVLVPGCSVPFIVRKRDNDKYTFIGECYIQGIMDGSLMHGSKEPLSTFELI